MRFDYTDPTGDEPPGDTSEEPADTSALADAQQRARYLELVRS